jgi:DNA-directed RNA polymerase subunit E'/Rpb7
MTEKSKLPKHNKDIYGVYIPSMLTMKVTLNITEIGKNVKQNLERSISKQTEGKCIAEGFIKPNSVKVFSYSAGMINGDNVQFQTMYDCMVCHPVEGMLIECQTKTITKAGVHAEVIDDNGIVPLTIFVARDHHRTEKAFATIKENAKINIRVIGIRYELNDPYISVIGKLVESGDATRGGDYQPIRQPITILED